jgi:hypothetical protein
MNQLLTILKVSPVKISAFGAAAQYIASTDFDNLSFQLIDAFAKQIAYHIVRLEKEEKKNV